MLPKILRLSSLLILLLTLLQLARAQTPLEVALPGVVGQGVSELVLVGRNLRGLEVWLGGRPLRVERAGDTEVRLELPLNLSPGEYPLSLRVGTQTLEREQGLLVLPGEDLPKSKGGGLEAETLERNRALLLTTPAQVARLEAGWRAAGFTLEFRHNPFLPQSEGVCGQVLLGLRDVRTSRSTSSGIQALVGALYREGSFRVAGRLIMRGPAGSGSTPLASSMPQRREARGLKSPFSVAVLDTGLSGTPLKGEQVDLVRARSFVDLARVGGAWVDGAVERTPSGALQSRQNVGHGTPVTALLARYTAASLLPLQVCDADGICRTSSLVAGICYAASLARDPQRPVRILNLSLSGEEHQPLVYEALREASRRGVSVVVASGNQRSDRGGRQPLSFPAHYSVAYAGTVHTWPPIPGLIAVGSLGVNSQPSSFSSAGPWVTVSARGEDLSLPRADGAGDALFSGTSFAAPRVSAWIAELLERDLSLNPAQVKARLLEAVRPVVGCPLERCGRGRLP